MFCAKCGKELSDDVKVCSKCKTPVLDDKVTLNDVTDFIGGGTANTGRTVESNVTMNTNQGMAQMSGIPIKGYNPYLDYTPIGMWGYFLYNILFNLPVVGWVLIILFSLGITKNVNLRNFARSWFCIYILMIIVIVFVMTVIMGNL